MPPTPLLYVGTCHGGERPCETPERLSLAQRWFSSVTTDLCLNISGLNHFTVTDEVTLPLSETISVLRLGMLLITQVILLRGFGPLPYRCDVFS